ncbi:serine-pyruvate aminotransferase/archaeal aspartate aminotransferase [Desulfitobacterium dehalogenans ATCC 51507]|uniref:Serine-pyruvate aminotransferase/archaeal aspartate aminotransferase n=1 Tax=Desulfitobacterium dehalogenans (strain ATCC 51507 / DSM 9161 / JW/IU-DC1) TaxID=756499 RepID=I4A8K8_DESDJ|nr:aminotransferase class V-fold PLP-dependent enzyme [Desulfitobacterium dehalogenans]AFM00293.1 serine-pyruvate aminotransferase/archaeal aspartate aminotransferase [Desulfitobacterium dehalogenans ATCC 51507]
MARTDLRFKIATSKEEFEQIHHLNYKTFVKEIPQHEANSQERLIDPFHPENIYCICLRRGKLVGMLACRDKRPFSIDRKLEDLDSYLPLHSSICEIRLLAVEKDVRGTRVLLGLMSLLFEHCQKQGYDLAVISGTVRQLKLYNHLGFKPFGPLVGTAAASYQPMYITREHLSQKLIELLDTFRSKDDWRESVNFLPGPVRIRQEVQEAFKRAPCSHRSEEFSAAMAGIKKDLTQWLKARHVQILLGSGTLANDVVGAYLFAMMGKKKGLVLSNGEFGNRLLDQARRAGLNFEEHAIPWGKGFDYKEIEKRLDKRDDPLQWLWAVHLETSTGVLNDLPRLKDLCCQHQIALAVDCVSSIGAVPMDLSGVYLASGVSGKALCSYPGLSFVCYNQVLKGGTLPRYMDLELYQQSEGVPFTQSSNLVYALQQALEYAVDRDMSINQRLGEWLRAKLQELGIQVLASAEEAAPNVLTLVLPQGIRSIECGDKLEKEGYALSYRSSYLRQRNWIQVCLMGEYEPEEIQAFPEVLGQCMKKLGLRDSKEGE